MGAKISTVQREVAWAPRSRECDFKENILTDPFHSDSSPFHSKSLITKILNIELSSACSMVGNSAFAVCRRSLRMSSSASGGRCWNQLTSLSKSADHSSKFRLSSWNILAQDYADRCSHLYGHLDSKKQLLKWPVRWSKISDEIKELDSDVLCLQEVQCSNYENEVRRSLKSSAIWCG